MIDYDLAKKLKEKGFDFSNSPTVFDDEVGCPTLSNLIEACGKDFAELQSWGNYTRYVEGNHKWCAFGFEKRAYGGGSTPEQAVALLWLELHK